MLLPACLCCKACGITGIMRISRFVLEKRLYVICHINGRALVLIFTMISELMTNPLHYMSMWDKVSLINDNHVMRVTFKNQVFLFSCR